MRWWRERERRERHRARGYLHHRDMLVFVECLHVPISCSEAQISCSEATSRDLFVFLSSGFNSNELYVEMNCVMSTMCVKDITRTHPRALSRPILSPPHLSSTRSFLICPFILCAAMSISLPMTMTLFFFHFGSQKASRSSKMLCHVFLTNSKWRVLLLCCLVSMKCGVHTSRGSDRYNPSPFLCSVCASILISRLVEYLFKRIDIKFIIECMRLANLKLKWTTKHKSYNHSLRGKRPNWGLSSCWSLLGVTEQMCQGWCYDLVWMIEFLRVSVLSLSPVDISHLHLHNFHQ